MVLLERSMVISLFEQQLVLVAAGQRFCYSVSTARNGPGQLINSGCTPLGRHFICKKIGAGLPANTVFVGRKETGEVYSDRLAMKNPQRDWILTRIIWLSGLEDGLNKGNGVDTKSRFIYIHGSPDSTVLGKPGSAGCVRMHNEDVVDLFDRIEEGDQVEIRSD